MSETIVFLVGAALILAGGIGVVAARNPVHSALFLVQTLMGVAVLFVVQGAHFLAAVQIIVYAGAIVILFLFVIMLLNVGQESGRDASSSIQRWGAIAAAVLFGGLLISLQWGGSGPRRQIAEEDVALTPFARTLFSEYLLVFELTGLLLLAAVVAATVLAKSNREARVKEEG